jgi:tRNA A37 N6-isopentenylltransferase MiaA
VLAGRATLDEAIARDTARTWAYVKRQRTWFRSEVDIQWLGGGNATSTAQALVDDFLTRSA